MRLSFAEEHAFHLSLFGMPTVYPMVEVALIGPRGKRVDTFALVDSGADTCQFHAVWAQRIGLRLKDGRPEPRGSMKKGASAQVYVHRISMIVGKKTKIRCEVAFSEDMSDEMTDQLIGREVVFDRVRFAFRQKTRMLYLSAEA